MMKTDPLGTHPFGSRLHSAVQTDRTPKTVSATRLAGATCSSIGTGCGETKEGQT